MTAPLASFNLDASIVSLLGLAVVVAAISIGAIARR